MLNHSPEIIAELATLAQRHYIYSLKEVSPDHYLAIPQFLLTADQETFSRYISHAVDVYRFIEHFPEHAEAIMDRYKQLEIWPISTAGFLPIQIPVLTPDQQFEKERELPYLGNSRLLQLLFMADPKAAYRKKILQYFMSRTHIALEEFEGRILIPIISQIAKNFPELSYYLVSTAMSENINDLLNYYRKNSPDLFQTSITQHLQEPDIQLHHRIAERFITDATILNECIQDYFYRKNEFSIEGMIGLFPEYASLFLNIYTDNRFLNSMTKYFLDQWKDLLSQRLPFLDKVTKLTMGYCNSTHYHAPTAKIINNYFLENEINDCRQFAIDAAIFYKCSRDFTGQFDIRDMIQKFPKHTTTLLKIFVDYSNFRSLPVSDIKFSEYIKTALKTSVHHSDYRSLTISDRAGPQLMLPTLKELAEFLVNYVNSENCDEATAKTISIYFFKIPSLLGWLVDDESIIDIGIKQVENYFSKINHFKILRHELPAMIDWLIDHEEIEVIVIFSGRLLSQHSDIFLSEAQMRDVLQLPVAQELQNIYSIPAMRELPILIQYHYFYHYFLVDWVHNYKAKKYGPGMFIANLYLFGTNIAKIFFDNLCRNFPQAYSMLIDHYLDKEILAYYFLRIIFYPTPHEKAWYDMPAAFTKDQFERMCQSFKNKAIINNHNKDCPEKFELNHNISIAQYAIIMSCGLLLDATSGQNPSDQESEYSDDGYIAILERSYIWDFVLLTNPSLSCSQIYNMAIQNNPRYIRSANILKNLLLTKDFPLASNRDIYYSDLYRASFLSENFFSILHANIGKSLGGYYDTENNTSSQHEKTEDHYLNTHPHHKYLLKFALTQYVGPLISFCVQNNIRTLPNECILLITQFARAGDLMFVEDTSYICNGILRFTNPLIEPLIPEVCDDYHHRMSITQSHQAFAKSLPTFKTQHHFFNSLSSIIREDKNSEQQHAFDQRWGLSIIPG